MTNVDAFLVDHVRFCAGRNHRLIITFINRRNKVLHSRGRIVVVEVCVSQITGRIHLTCKDIRNSL